MEAEKRAEACRKAADARRPERKQKDAKGGVLLSLVIAAYNVEAYVRQCIDSVLRAGLKRIEIILVTAASADRTEEICSAYADGETITCIRQDGSGLSNARNCGVKAARGAYVTFMDADDCVQTECFRQFYRFFQILIQKRTFDALANDFFFVDEAGRPFFESRQIKAAAGKTAGRSYTRRFVRSRGTFWNAWRYVYRRSYLLRRQRKFAEGRTCEDLDFAVRTLLDGADILFCHMPYYGYRPMRAGSLTNHKNLKMVEDFSAVERELLDLCRRSRKKRPGGNSAGNRTGEKASADAGKRALASDIEEKLKALMLLSLPDIYEVKQSGRRKAVAEYRRLFRQTPLPRNVLMRLPAVLCRSGCLNMAGFVLWKLKHIRRKARYR